MNLSGILIGSADPERLAAYYTELFDKPGWDQDGYTGWQFGAAWVVVGPHDEVQGNNAAPGRLIWNLETPDVRGEFARLKEAGAIVVKEPYNLESGGQDTWIATLADPDDNYFQLMSPMQ